MSFPLRFLSGALIPVCCSFTSAPLADIGSQFIDPVDGMFDASAYLEENAFGFLPVPVIITEPAVDGGLGVMGLFFHEGEVEAAARKEAMATSGNASAHLLPPNVSALFGAYTGNGSWMVGAGHMGFFKQDKIRYKGGVALADIQLDYYSLGGVDLPRPLTIRTEAAAILQTLIFRLGDLPVYLGPTQRYIQAELSSGNDLASMLPSTTPPGLADEIESFFMRDVTTSGLGLHLELDTRDNVLSPSRGLQYELDYVAYRDAFGSDIHYDGYRLSGLNYFHLGETWRAGVRLEAEAVESDEHLPPFALPAVDLRGIPAARYQGTHVGEVEVQLTWQMNSRWGVLGFAGVGKAAESDSDFSSADSLTTRGLGFRYQIARRYGLNMGIDVARGPEDTVWYIQAGSAW